MTIRMPLLILLVAAWAIPLSADEAVKSAAVAPDKTTSLFNGKDLSGLTTWLKETKREDPRGVFKVEEGMLHLSGDGDGYVATEKEYRDYRLQVEYKWGKKSDGGKYVRNSGILLHATGPDGGAGGAWPSCIECQLAQGCAGDFILIRGKDEAGKEIPVKMTAETESTPGIRTVRWKKGGVVKSWPPTRGQLWWNNHDLTFEELIDTRGKHDVESPTGEWNRAEIVCAGSKITVSINGHVVNECYDVFPSAGRILLQTEGFEIWFRKFEISPLK
ncbi:MAG: DUF1080 domain-containing protein [Pirellulaceae bacterium]